MTGYLVGSQEWLTRNAYTVERCGPIEWRVLDDENSGAEVCRARSHADAVRKLIELRFTD